MCDGTLMYILVAEYKKSYFVIYMILLKCNYVYSASFLCVYLLTDGVRVRRWPRREILIFHS